MNSTPSSTPTPKHIAPRWRAILLLLIVFVAGAGCGLGGSLFLFRWAVRKAFIMPVTASGPLDRLAGRIESQLNAKLNLTVAERDAVREELTAGTQRAKEIRLRVANEIRALAGDTVSRIERRLPVEKQAGLRELAKARLEPWGLQPAVPEARQDRSRAFK